MSLDDRCLQFHEAALGTGKTKGPVKEIATLRKFLHKNQNQRFTDKAVSRLFDAIQIYVNKDDLDKESKEGLLEDSLKMPFTVFSTKQKKTMIKWLEDLRGTPLQQSVSSNNAKDEYSILSVIDFESGKVTLMSDETGDTFENITVEGDLGESIKKAFEQTDGCISVEAQLSSDGETVEKVIRLKEQ